MVGTRGYVADDRTVNRLIFFKDGFYLELIAFIHDDPVRAAGHGWDKDFGLVDVALTTRRPFDHAALRGRLQQSTSDILYTDPIHGRRTQLKEWDVEWEVTFPTGIERGAVPFWCHDVTPREARVPGTEGNTQHPCGAIGVAGIIIETGEAEFDRVQAALAVIVGSVADCVNLGMRTPYDIGKLERPNIRLRKHLAGDRAQLRLSLVLYNPRILALPAIAQRVGSGVVSIQFEA